MTLYDELTAFRVRPDAAPVYLHASCQQELKKHPGRQNTDDAPWILKCDLCDKVIGKWQTKDEMNMELRLWSERVHNGKDSMKQVRKNRFSPGRRVLVGMMNRPGTVKSVADVPSIMGEFVHEILLDGQTETMKAVGCDIQPIPELDEDLRAAGPSIHIKDSNVANLNVGTQIGTINAALQVLSNDDAQREIARAIKELTDAVLSNATLPENEKREVVEALSTVADQAAKKPEERSTGTLKAVVAWIPTAISAVSNLATLWEKFGPAIKTYFGF